VKQRTPFKPGDPVLVSIRNGSGGYTEQPAKVKEMAGARSVAVSINGRDRIVQVSDCRREQAAVEVPARPALVATVGESVRRQNTSHRNQSQD